MVTRVPTSAEAVRVRNSTSATEAIDGSASPRKPNECRRERSSTEAIFEVAWRSNAMRASRFVHAATVIDNLDQCTAPLLEIDRHRSTSSIDGIFQQLLHDRSRPSYNFSRGNLIRHAIRQYSDLFDIHRRFSSYRFTNTRNNTHSTAASNRSIRSAIPRRFRRPWRRDATIPRRRCNLHCCPESSSTPAVSGLFPFCGSAIIAGISRVFT